MSAIVGRKKEIEEFLLKIILVMSNDIPIDGYQLGDSCFSLLLMIC
jgi:hypothetical protein